ncbi:hypothetical protein RB195_007202 [Necator americanus]|uniref:Uncharacterized protein n=1 Tax=Necator americanus TaxID=51031 RepID=A0ABR1BW44_NECAM
MESLATTIRLVTLNCRTLSSELQQTALSRVLQYLSVAFAPLQKTRMRDTPINSIENYAMYCCDADEKKVSGYAVVERNDCNGMVEEFGSTPSRWASYDCEIAEDVNSGSQVLTHLHKPLRTTVRTPSTMKSKRFDNSTISI